MANKRLLTNRQWHTNGNWYAPLNLIRENFSSVVYCDHIDTTSSAGDHVTAMVRNASTILNYRKFFNDVCNFIYSD
jgi:hypothetical protein